MRENWIYRRGDIYYANLNPFVGSEQGGKRPVLVLQNNDGNFFSSTLIIAPLTTRVYKKQDLPTHYTIEKAKGLMYPSIVMLEQIRTIDKKRIISYLGKVSKDQMEEIDDHIRVSLDLWIPETVDVP